MKDISSTIIGVFVGVLLAGGVMFFVHDTMAESEFFDCNQHNAEIARGEASGPPEEC